MSDQIIVKLGLKSRQTQLKYSNIKSRRWDLALSFYFFWWFTIDFGSIQNWRPINSLEITLSQYSINELDIIKDKLGSPHHLYLVCRGELGDVSLHLDDAGERGHGLEIHRHDLHVLPLLLWPLKLLVIIYYSIYNFLSLYQSLCWFLSGFIFPG